ncbi:MAG: hypothetical protein NVSMB47_21950 [Polyangiales bacterium]
MEPDRPTTVLLTGATGFVGSHALPRLLASGLDVRCATRDVDKARAAHPDRTWVPFDLSRPESIAPALRGCRAALYLVHEMAAGDGYEEREAASAEAFRQAAADEGVERIVYLGGVAPKGKPSRHLRSRLHTGELLRAGRVPVFELRASMIVGHGSLSWQIVRDLAMRLPAMILPRWLSTRSQPVAIDDVAFALERALTLSVSSAGVHDLPGPDVLSAKEILLRIARLRGKRPITLSVPILSPRLSSYWLRLVTGANYHVARELIEGLSSDLLADGRGLWAVTPDHAPLSFDEAARRALAEDERSRGATA